MLFAQWIFTLLLGLVGSRAGWVPSDPDCASALRGDISLRAEVTRLTRTPVVRRAFAALDRRYRSGWVRRGIPNSIGETILAHSQKVFTAAMLYPDPENKLNRRRLALMALFHDLAEYVIPDFTPHDTITAEEKHALERDCLRELVRRGADPLILELWEEYEAQATPEARVVFQLDKLDAAVQAVVYEKMGFDVGDFFPYTEKKVSEPLLLSLFSQLREHPHDPYAYYFAALCGE